MDMFWVGAACGFTCGLVTAFVLLLIIALMNKDIRITLPHA